MQNKEYLYLLVIGYENPRYVYAARGNFIYYLFVHSIFVR